MLFDEAQSLFGRLLDLALPGTALPQVEECAERLTAEFLDDRHKEGSTHKRRIQDIAKS